MCVCWFNVCTYVGMYIILWNHMNVALYIMYVWYSYTYTCMYYNAIHYVVAVLMRPRRPKHLDARILVSTAIIIYFISSRIFFIRIMQYIYYRKYVFIYIIMYTGI